MTSPLKLDRTTAEPPPTQPQQPARQPGPGPKPAGPTHPTPTGPPSRTGDAKVLSDIDDALIGLLAMAYFGPAEQGTAKSVEVVCASEVLLFRLRMVRRAVAEMREALELPARQIPIKGRGPGGLGPNSLVARGKELTPSSAAVAPARESTDVAANSVGAGALLPARQVPLIRARVSDDTVSAPDGLGPIPSVAAEKERTPRSAAAIRSVARGSTGAVVAPGAGADVPDGFCEGSRPGRNGRADGAVGAATFANPNTRVSLRFEEGTDRLVGAAEPVLIPQLVGVAWYDAQRRSVLRNP